MSVRHKNIVLVLSLAAFFVLLGFNAPLITGLWIGKDDRFELCKAQLLARQPELAVQLCNDQPWLHTIITAGAFALFGESAAIPRVFTMGLTFLLVLACWHIMGKASSILERVLFVCVFFASNLVPTLTTSAMLEPAAIALALVAVACSYSTGQPLSRGRAYSSGVLLALAVFTKLTSLIILPAWAALIWQERRSTPLRLVLPRVAFGFVIGAMCISALSPPFSFDSLWISHWKVHESQLGNALQLQDVFTEWTILLPVSFGIVKLREYAARPAALFALVWLLTDFCVHTWHKPWREYYAIHFHIPLSLLAALGAGWIIMAAWDAISPAPDALIRRRGGVPQIRASLVGLVAAFVIASWCGIRFPLFCRELRSVASRETAHENQFVPLIRQYASGARWIYCSEPGNVAFHGGVMQPPEFVIMTTKRLVTGDFDPGSSYLIARSYEPELVLVRRDVEFAEPKWRRWLVERKYVRVMGDDMSDLWVSPTLNPSEEKRPEHLITSLGL